MDEKDEQKNAEGEPGAGEPAPEKGSALEAYVPGPPVSEPDDVGEVPAVEDAREEPLAPPEAEEGSVLPLPQVRAVLEALVFASPQPITPKEIGRVLQGVPREDWQKQLAELQADYARDERGLQIVEIAGGFQVTTRPEYNDWVRELLDPRTPTRLSIQALETLAVIAYKQPVTLPEIIELRGVKSGGVVKTLLEKRLIRIMGRKEVVGRPILYGTTKQFLLHFGLRDLEELPKIEEFAEVLGEEVDVAGLKRAIESPLPVQVGLSDPDGEQIPLFEEPPPEGGGSAGGTDEPVATSVGDEPTGDEPTGDEPDRRRTVRRRTVRRRTVRRRTARGLNPRPARARRVGVSGRLLARSSTRQRMRSLRSAQDASSKRTHCRWPVAAGLQRRARRRASRPCL